MSNALEEWQPAEGSKTRIIGSTKGFNDPTRQTQGLWVVDGELVTVIKKIGPEYKGQRYALCDVKRAGVSPYDYSGLPTRTTEYMRRLKEARPNEVLQLWFPVNSSMSDAELEFDNPPWYTRVMTWMAYANCAVIFLLGIAVGSVSFSGRRVNTNKPWSGRRDSRTPEERQEDFNRGQAWQERRGEL